jgi:hypothetical protein
LPPKSQRFETTAMHYTTIDPKKVRESTTRPCTTPPLTPQNTKIRTHDHALHHWPPKRQRFEPTTMHYTTNDPKSKRFEPTNPRPCTTPPFTPQKS